MRSASTSGCKRNPTTPIHSASVVRPISMPWRAKIACCRYSGRWSVYFWIVTWARRPGAAIPRSRIDGATGSATIVSQAQQAYCGWTSRREELHRLDVELLRDVLADLHQRATAGRAVAAVRLVDGLDARKLGRQRAALRRMARCGLVGRTCWRVQLVQLRRHRGVEHLAPGPCVRTSPRTAAGAAVRSRA